MHITIHAYNRGKQRMGLSKSAFERTAVRAYLFGTGHDQTKGKVRKYLAQLHEAKGTADNSKLYGRFVYVFSGTSLITVHLMPKEIHEYKKYKK